MCRLWWLVTLVAAVAMVAPVAAVVGGGPAAAPEPDAAVVFVQKHGLSARLEGIKDNRLGYYSFYGIRFAEPPVGPRRFQRPVRRYLAGEITANRNCMPCPQPDPWNSARVIGHEDCLCLNVYAPKMPGDEQGCPVVFFIHGGNYKSGSTASYGFSENLMKNFGCKTELFNVHLIGQGCYFLVDQHACDGQYLTQKDTILVTAQYRLGSLGYFSTADKDASGNAGLFDLRAAMAWINDYIEFFGGDPARVVVMGQGSGGSAASLMALSNEGRSARGVAALSGTPLSTGAVRPDPAKYAKELANRTGCPEKPVERLLKCLRQLPTEKIVLADNEMSTDNVDTKKFLDQMSGRSGSGARVEGKDDLRGLPPLVDEAPADSLKNKRQPGPLLTGVTSAETSRAVFGKYSQFLTDKLSKIKDFIKTELVGGLKDVVGGVQGLLSVPTGAVTQILPIADYYQTLFDNSLNAVDGLTQIAEATGDALFNLPAYQTVQAWSDGSPAYLYTFEHVGNLSKGSHFLPGLPLTDSGNNTEDQFMSGPAHGDELAYIFQPLNDDGKPVSEDISSTDARMRDAFVGLISKFAHDLSPIEHNNKTNSFELLPFSKENDQFIKMKDGISLDKNFRFCQMGLWGNMAERVTGSLCKDVLGNLLKLPKLPVDLPLPGNPKLPISPPQIPIVPNIFGANPTPTSKKTTEDSKEVIQVTRSETRRPSGLSSIFSGF